MRDRVIGPSPNDEELRKAVVEALMSARSEVIVIAGELTLLHFPDVYEAYQKTRQRGIKVKIYASDASHRNVKALESIGCQVKIGRKRFEEHYMLVDGKTYLKVDKFDKNPPTIGKRTAKVGTDDPDLQKRIPEWFDKGMSQVRKTAFASLITSAMTVGLFSSILILNAPAELVAPVLVAVAILLSWILFR